MASTTIGGPAAGPCVCIAGPGEGCSQYVRARIRTVDDYQSPPASLEAFLAGVERRAFRRAQLATRDRDEALDLVQDAMLQLARNYAQRPAAEWAALFQRILTNRIRDWQRRAVLQRRIFFWRDAVATEDGSEDALDGIADASNDLGGYLVVKAESQTAAATLFLHPPSFAIFPGEAVEVMEILPMPGK